MEAGERHDAASPTPQKEAPEEMSKRKVDGGASSGTDIRASMLRSSPDALQEEASPQAAASLGMQISSLQDEKNTTGVGAEAVTQTQEDDATVQEEVSTYPEYYYYNNYHYNDQEYVYKEHMYDYGEGGDGTWPPQEKMSVEEEEKEEEEVVIDGQHLG